LDRSFWFQISVISLLAFQISEPTIFFKPNKNQFFILLLDNSPNSRTRQNDKTMYWDFVKKSALEFIEKLGSEDRVALVQSSPITGWVTQGGAILQNPSTAKQSIMALHPALSSPPPSEVLLWALSNGERLSSQVSDKVLSQSNAPPVFWAFSPSAPPDNFPKDKHGYFWQTVGPLDLPASPVPRNTAIVAFGATAWDLPEQEAEEKAIERFVKIMIALKNFGPEPENGFVAAYAQTAAERLVFKYSKQLNPGQTEEVFHRLPFDSLVPLRINWVPDRPFSERFGDMLPEDDEIFVSPKTIDKPVIRVHGEAPRLKLFFQLALDAVVKTARDPGRADLDLWLNSVPTQEPKPTEARSLLIINPSGGFGPFEIGGKEIHNPQLELESPDPLLENFSFGGMPGATDLAVGTTKELKIVGTLKKLIVDAESGRTLLGRFSLSGARPGFVCAFSLEETPGRSGSSAARPLPPAVTVLLLRMLREARGVESPYALVRAAEAEKRLGAPLALAWKPDEIVGGVLDPSASDLKLGPPTTPGSRPVAAVTAAPVTFRLDWALSSLVFLLVLLELRLGAGVSIGAARAPIPRPGEI
jgi:hypothetical protein